MRKVKDFLLVNVGLFLVALGIDLFKVPNNFVTGGVSGISIITSHFFPGLSVGPIMMIVNILLLLVGFMLVSVEFGWMTAYASFALSGMVWALERFIPVHSPLTGDTFIELVFAILLPAVGSAIVFNQDASTGGTDIIAKILTKHTHFHVGKTLFFTDFLIASSAFFVFGIHVGMYSILGLILKAFIIDLVIENMNVFKYMMIISDHPDPITYYITNTLKRGATLHKAIGAFSKQERTVISTVVSRQQAVSLRKFVKKADDKAFITITNTSEIIGKGFRNIDL